MNRFTENAIRVLRARYLKKDEAGAPVEGPADLFRRVARTIADVELQYSGAPAVRDEWEGRFYDLMVEQRFMPNSPTLMNAGREMGMLSACFVLPVPDSIDGIFDSIKHTALIQKAGGGTGFAFDELRPTGDYISSSGGTTSGPISFWRAFSEATNAIQQGAFRRGANMGMMYIDHPDILKFLYAKQDLTQFTNYNISVKVTDEWMNAFKADADSPHVVRNPRTKEEFLLPFDLSVSDYGIQALVRRSECTPAVDSEGSGAAGGAFVAHKGKTVRVYTRREIWNVIIRNAWQTGEPGLCYIDRVNEHNPTPHVGRIEATNPCGEQPLLPYEACNLGSVNLGAFVRHACTPDAEVDWEGLRATVNESTRFLDNVIDANNYPLPEIDAVCKANRKIGIGIMGFADALYQLGVAYNSEEGIRWGERLMKFVNDEAHRCSEQLARERGPFPNWRGSRWDTVAHRPMRNAAITTVAPTGTISIIANCSGGIEPMFSLVFFRNVLKGQREGATPMVEVNDTFRRVAEERGLLSEGLMEQIAKEGTLAHTDGIPDDVKRVFVTARDISPDWHVRMQAAFQKHCDSSISKTINFPHDAKLEDVETIYRLSYELDCKGVTVYRDGCRESQPMALKDSDNLHKQAATGAPDAGAATRRDMAAKPLRPRDLPEIVSGLRIRQVTPFGNMHVKITVDPKTERELEVFAQLGKGGDIANSDLEAICRMISLWLRAGGGLDDVIRQLRDIGSSLQIPTREGKIMSLGDGLARAMMKYRRAKEYFSLKSLLLGDIDLAELDQLPQAGAVSDRTPVVPGKPNGNGNGGSNGNGHKNGNGKTVGMDAGASLPEVRHEIAEFRTRMSDGTAAAGTAVKSLNQGFKTVCPECQSAIHFGEGCNKCSNPSCGWAQC